MFEKFSWIATLLLIGTAGSFAAFKDSNHTSAKQSCCSPDAACCLEQQPCCDSAKADEPQCDGSHACCASHTCSVKTEDETLAATEPTCCAKNAYCCHLHLECCHHPKDAVSDSNAQDGNSVTVASVSSDLPACCADNADCCKSHEECCP